MNDENGNGKLVASRTNQIYKRLWLKVDKIDSIENLEKQEEGGIQIDKHCFRGLNFLLVIIRS